MPCWDKASVLDIIPVEAESPSEAVFSATHSNLSIYRRTDLQKNLGEVVHEDQLLEAVLTQPADQPIIPILGNSGTGKSHLVRWLRMKLLTKEYSNNTRRVIFVPKHKMSLRAILELVLDQTASVEALEFRQRINEATEQLSSEKDARNRLRATLSYLIAESRGQAQRRDDDEEDEREYLAHSLPNLLDDPIFKPRLLDDDGALARLSKEKFSGKSSEDKEDPFEFTAEDLRLSIDDTNRASADAREVAEALAGDLGLRELAARMLNEQLSPAVSSVFGVGGDDLKNLLIDLRQELQLKNPDEEILLLIEDFSIFQGVQGGLIDAMTQIPTVDAPICPMKVVMAVTTGYFNDQVPDTAKTRTYCAFDLDVPDSAQTTELAPFATPYLNAVRVGAQALERAHSEGESTPNACDDCPLRDECHSAFGAYQGIGLFPFNQTALERTVRSKQSDTGIFNARSVLKDVLRPVLFEDHDPIAGAKFPTAQFESRFPLLSENIEWNIEETAQIRSPGEADDIVNRRRRLLTYYAEQPAPQNLKIFLHEAFQIPTVAGLPNSVENSHRAGTKRGERVKTPGPVTTPTPVPQSSHDSALVQAVDSWAKGQSLKQDPQNDLRKLVFKAIVEKINFEDGLRGDTSWTVGGSRAVKGSQLFGHQQSVNFEGSKRDASGVLIEIKREDIDAVRTVRALAQLSSGKGWREIEPGAQLQRLATRQIAMWARNVEEQLAIERDNLRKVNQEVGFLATALLQSAQMLGLASSFHSASPDDLIAAILAAAPEEVSSALPAPIQNLRRLATEEKGKSSRQALQQLLLRRTSYTQGGGADAGVNTARILISLEAYEADPQTPNTLPNAVVDYAKRIAALHNNVGSLREAVEGAVPDTAGVPQDIEDAVQKIDSAFKRLQTLDLVSNTVDVSILTQLGQELDSGDIGLVDSLREKLRSWDSLSNPQRLEALAGDWPNAAARLGSWLGAVNAAFSSADALIASKIDPDLAQGSNQLDNRLADELESTLAMLEGVE